jgi:transcriptional regulator with XRE-family HTH domain
MYVKASLTDRFHGSPETDPRLAAFMEGIRPKKKQTQVTKQELGHRLRAIRRSRGITQREVAEILGTNQSHISNVERGARGLTIQQVVKLSKALRVSADELLVGNHRSLDPQSLRSGRLIHRLQRIEELPADQQKAVIKILDCLLDRA